MGSHERQQIPVEVSRVIAPDGQPSVLLQMPDGWMVMTYADAVNLGKNLIEVGEAGMREARAAQS